MVNKQHGVELRNEPKTFGPRFCALSIWLLPLPFPISDTRVMRTLTIQLPEAVYVESSQLKW